MVISTENLVHYMVCAFADDFKFVSNMYCIYIAGPRLTVNCLTDHRTWYNLQVCYIG
jgi:hypothetical protein